MKLTLKNVKQLKQDNNSKLFKRVCNYVIDEWSNYEDKKNIFKDVLYNGCRSGVVCSLIYYKDTVQFYKQYREEIDNLLYQTMEETGLYAPKDLFGNK